jgi:hypothetical protein
MKIIGTSYTTPPEYEHNHEWLRDIIENAVYNLDDAGLLDEFLEQYFGDVDSYDVDLRNKDSLIDYFHDGVGYDDVIEIFDGYEEYIDA